MRRLKAWFRLKFRRAPLVPRLVAGIAGLELDRGTYARLAPVKGVYGAFKIEGNGLPTITYDVFDKSLMEFVKVQVAIALPSTILFEATTADLGKVPVKRVYERPFRVLAKHLYRYFPLPMPEKPRIN